MSDKAGYEREDWERHYESGDLQWDLGAVSPPFLHLWEDRKLVPGKTLIPGCGRGHEVLFLAEKGFQVTAVDFASGAVQSLAQSLEHHNLDCQVLQANFFELDSGHDGLYDLMLEQTFFCAINPSQRKAYVETAHRILSPGAHLMGLFYETGETGGPPFNTTEADILKHFSCRFEIEQLEKTPHSIDRRKGKEWLGIFKKK